ncbi:endonuclease/exonuclease/phosphatase family protein [Flagellimonas meishanensis]|uniref:endonuclease/exonuclease/phosphatase family protein n=1 Tax=Flagellimonas meishanensis TaxID=2873264 RepID=UPI001CA674E6|nr:endonuclease/exonuclease/phosphatase family protein [[Muricauda] meishanensis]
MAKLSPFNKVVFFINTILALVTFIAILVPFVPVTAIPALSVLSLIFPLLIVLNFLFFGYWILVGKRNFLLSGTLLLFWYFFLGPFFQFSNGNGHEIDGDTFSIMSFNARSFNDLKQMDVENVDSLILNFVAQKDPDILCFQECYYAMKRNNALSQYKYKFVDYVYGKHSGKVIQAIYSKYPIANVDSVDFPNSSNKAIFADILFNKDTIRVYNLHLQSFRIVPELNTIKNEQSSRLFAKSRRVMLKQYEQVNLVRADMEENHFKKLVVGDFNNTQYSNVYRTIKGGMQDTFLEKGQGFGRTYDLLGFPIRIDYILADPEFEVLTHQNFSEKLSDHYPIMATLRLKAE